MKRSVGIALIVAFAYGVLYAQQDAPAPTTAPSTSVPIVRITSPLGRLCLHVEDAEALLSALPKAIENARKPVDD